MDLEQCSNTIESDESCLSLELPSSPSESATAATITVLLDFVWLLYWLVLKTLLFVAILIIIPLLVISFLYLTSLYVHLYQLWNKISEDYSSKVYERARNNAAWAWNLIGKIWFGYEIHGLENLPKEGGAILVYYHGTISIDIYFIISKIRLECNRSLNTVADRILYKFHGLKLLWRVFAVNNGTREECIRILKEGNLLAIAPGGTREAYFGDNTYPLMWYQRKGFAIVAKEAQVPIIPVFTQNCREAFRTLKIG